MPRRVDHEERRSKILEALISVATREGLHAVSLRSVAAEAGVSLRLVQYYFETKGGLMAAGLARLERVSHARWADRLAALPQPPGARATLDALCAEALPTDPASRDFHLLWMSYTVLALTDPGISDRVFVEGPARLQRRIVEILERGKAGGEFPASLDAGVEATLLLGLIHGLGTAVLVGQQTATNAAACLSFHLDRLASGTAPPGTTGPAAR